MLDLVIRNGRVVDGTGAPAFKADIGVKDGRIVAVGEVAEPAATQVDAAGKVVAPGFIDPHTHFDAQVCWDPFLAPAPHNGSTTIIFGNVSATFAFLAPC